MPRKGDCKLNQKMRDQLIMLSAAGRTMTEIAEHLGVARSTIHLWMANNPELSDTVLEGRQIADEMVESAMFHNAIGYSATYKKPVVLRDGHGNGEFSERIEYVDETKVWSPNAVSQMFWLKNRNPKRWRDRVEEPPQTIDELVFEDENESN